MNSAATVDPNAAGSQIDALYRGASSKHRFAVPAISCQGAFRSPRL
jgi:hypothetical protein